MRDRCRLWAISDVHSDHRENRELLLSLDEHGYREDCLVLAGDVTDQVDALMEVLAVLSSRFAAVAYVPGNHELWLPRSRGFADSWEKFHHIIERCGQLGVMTRPFRLNACGDALWVVPLMSWYSGPEDDPAYSLFREKTGVTDRTHEMWGDFRFTRWPQDRTAVPLAQQFAAWNLMHLDVHYDAPVVTFSHFLPRQELIFPSEANLRRLPPAARRDPAPSFNFSRVAGSWRVDEQLRAIGSRVHIYGHQHRNRTRRIDGVTYLSHCMAYPRERRRGYVAEAASRPRLIWEGGRGFAI